MPGRSQGINKLARTFTAQVEALKRYRSGGGPKGKRNGNYKHGLFTAEAVQMRRTVLALIRASRQSIADLSGEHD